MPVRPIILASTSPFRRELLARLGVPFTAVGPEIDERPWPGEPPTDTALRLSEAKARAVARDFPGALIIGSDQVAFLDGVIFGKPGGYAKAVEQLRALRGRRVNFFTGLCLLDARSGRANVRGVPTQVTFRHLADEEIEAYLCKEPAYDCAGSAKSEGLGIALMAKIDGEDPTALVGLPLIALCDLLRIENVPVLL